MADVREYLVEMISRVCSPEPVNLSDHSRPLLDSGLDSLDVASVLMAIEDHFRITIADDDIHRLGTIDALVAYVEGSKR
jgi:acyl carrier protein